MKLLLSGGGTGGHIYPALALAEGIKQELPNCQIRFVGAQGGMEEKIVPTAGYELKTLSISGIDRSSPRKALASLLRVPGALRDARRLVREFQPDVVVGTGGYASFPVVYAAARQGVPTAIHEQNAYPGIANRILASRVDLVMITFTEARDRLKAKRVVVTGLPVREAVLQAAKNKSAFHKSEKKNELTLLAFGGSQGAQVINQAIWEMTTWVPNEWRIIWVTGRQSYHHWQDKLKQKPGTKSTVEMHPYLDNIEQAMTVSDLAVCRAGASTLAELTIMGLPAILIPFPLAAENHQEKNARSLEAAGGARVIMNSELDGHRLMAEVESIQAHLPMMSNAMQGQSAPEARDIMVKLVRELSQH
ncbi:MAG: undecaprenyldiphospho-muramoylpentapeptide beta-N-acetylglucosaminyltransferase [Methylocystaceae bacterium]